METRCQKCGAVPGADQAFCPKCGAVVGMSDAAPRRGEGWDMAATMVGQQLPPAAPRPRPSAERPSHAAEARPAPKGGNAVLLAVIGFVAVLAIGGLVVLLLYLNSQG
ncbi:MAG: zinc ribbon domain-containing protein [Acidobacteria bacterium]|nr:zinc ribbon domain-containing protein [Acidobacteriota bacterium]